MVIAHQIMDSLSEMFKGQKEGEANVAHSKRFQKGLSFETKYEPLSSGFKKIQKKKGGKGKRSATVAKSERKAKETSSLKQLEEGEMTLKVGTGDVISAHAVAKEPLELIHSDLCGLMNHKFEALEKFKEYKAEFESLLSRTIKILQFDRGIEYMHLRFQDYMKNMKSNPNSQYLLPSSFWGYAVKTVGHILNNVPSKSVSETPFSYGEDVNLV
ncbi:gag/pol protein [Cucumis melo var. makuwa]|uniref:Gag/pol protein n=1 Tax=Cucumis melo var. makuwa TaxID=1194695 RepID=A0A5A7UJ71_CUCMM|nr:gag/pol protein [Cucumis melo var. makuwa]TYK08624.1 gag/pol protein [Cucumis melo var. makuwa]